MKPKPPSSSSSSSKPVVKPLRPPKVPVKNQNGESSKSKKEKLKDDLSVLMKSITTSVTSLQDIVKLFKNATPEVIDLITNECSIILECKICKNLFRSLANFMTHKRGFCLGKFEQLFQNHEHGDHVWYSKYKKSKVLSSRSTSRKDILSLLEAMKNSTETESSEVTVLKDMETTNHALFNLRYDSQDPSKDLERSATIDAEEIPDDSLDGDTPEGTKCNFCPKEFSSPKSLGAHLKQDHEDLKMCYVCPCCKKYFSNSWCVYRHMYKVHRKSSEQVRKLRNQIQKKQVRLEEIERTKKGHSFSPVEERDTEKAFMEDLKGHGSLQHCSECGKKFDRKVALIAHAATCQGKSTAMPPSLLRSLKRKALNPVKIGDEKKPKYSAEEMYLRLRALDARVLLTKADSLITIKKENSDETYEWENISPKTDDEIKSLVRAYQGKDETVAVNSEFEDLLDKIHMEVNDSEPICLSDSDHEEKVNERVQESLDPLGRVSPASHDDESASQFNDLDSRECEIESRGGITEMEDSDESEDRDDPDSPVDNCLILSEDDKSLTDENPELVLETEIVDKIEDGESSDNFISVCQQNYQNGSSEKDESEFKEENEYVLENDLEEVDEENIEIQEVCSDSSSILFDDNIDHIHVKDIYDSESKRNYHDGSIVWSNQNQLRNSEISGGNDDSEDEMFNGFSDVEDDSSPLPLQYVSINNNRNKILSKDNFESSSQKIDSERLKPDSPSDLHSSPQIFNSNDNLSIQYALDDDNNCIVAKEIILFNDSDGVCFSNSDDCEVSEDSLENSYFDSSKNHFTKMNGDCTNLSKSPELFDELGDGDSVSIDEWLNKKINSLMNFQNEEKLSSDKKKRKCLLCPKTFRTLSFVRRHIASHYNIFKFKCLVNSCKFQSFLRSDMENHLSKVHKKKVFKTFFGRLYPRKEDFDDIYFIPDPNPFNTYPNCKKNPGDVPENESTHSNSTVLDTESLDDLNICEELPCLDEGSPNILR